MATPTAPMESSRPTDPSGSPSSPSPSTPEVDRTYYTWSNFFNILLSRATPEATEAYFHAHDLINEPHDKKRVKEDVEALYASSPIIRFLRHEIRGLGHDVPPEKVLVKRCEGRQGGGVDYNYGFMVCANLMQNRGHVEDTLAHEMIHVYDHLRFDVRLENLRHQACTEIRASTLSGECRFTREFFTKHQWKITQQLQECVRRRATLSLATRPNCRDQKHAEQVVNEVWDSCFNDTRPFDQIFR